MRSRIYVFLVAIGLLFWTLAFLAAPWNLSVDRNGTPMPRGVILFDRIPLTEGWTDPDPDPTTSTSSTISTVLRERGKIWAAVLLWTVTACGTGSIVLRLRKNSGNTGLHSETNRTNGLNRTDTENIANERNVANRKNAQNRSNTEDRKNKRNPVNGADGVSETGESDGMINEGPPATGMVERITATALGWSLLATLTFTLGWIGCLSRAVFLTIPGIVLSIWIGLRWRDRKRSGNGTVTKNVFPGSSCSSVLTSPTSHSSGTDSTGVGGRWIGLVIPLAIVYLLASPLPPFEFDVCEYHLQVPKEWFQNGQITYLPHNVYGNMPLGAEIPALAFAAVTRDPWIGAQMAKTSMAVFSLLIAAFLFFFLKSRVSPGAGALAALFWLATPLIAQNATFGLNDAFLAGYAFLTAMMGVIACENALCHGEKKEYRNVKNGRLNGHNLRLRTGDDANDVDTTVPGTDPPRIGTSENSGVLRSASLTPLYLAGFFAGSAAACKYTAVPFVLIPT
ncbi:MAG: hypothetical protein Q4C47_06135, partial [Planctomycetia bacterium]|nr:hypothetical protein [Planctomycetia bacterium]